MKKLEQLKTFEDACKVLGLQENLIPELMFLEGDKDSVIAYMKLIVIVRAANKLANDGTEWNPNWDDEDEYKYYPWFWMDGGSSGFRLSVYGDQRSDSSSGSRLCFISSEVSNYVAKQFIDLYKQFMII